eukprot:TRINITY_DN2957_c0_g1_i1.p1 TRINITY_DN2957_c0_g1~~TRINITY_DN2957_c0_g1_i1.p1  ORF type:complete len:166 (+),score=20.40 TRINITY_DN2957_c0_g1_i1:74-499(+)
MEEYAERVETGRDSPRSSSSPDLIALIEKERQERIRNGVDPVLMGKRFRVQEELLRHNRFQLRGKAMATLTQMKGSIAETTDEVADFTRERLNSMFDAAANVLEDWMSAIGVGNNEAQKKSAQIDKSRGANRSGIRPVASK